MHSGIIMTATNLILYIGIAFLVVMIILALIAVYNEHTTKKQYSNELLAFETCVSCGLITATPRSEDISIRRYYIEGTGELCESCYNIVYTDMSNHISSWDA